MVPAADSDPAQAGREAPRVERDNRNNIKLPSRRRNRVYNPPHGSVYPTGIRSADVVAELMVAIYDRNCQLPAGGTSIVLSTKY